MAGCTRVFFLLQGQYQLSLYLNDEFLGIQDISPIFVVVVPNTISKASELQKIDSQIPVAITTKMQITGRDQYFNRITIGGERDLFQVRVW